MPAALQSTCALAAKGWYITHYEVLSLLGVKNEALPRQSVPVTKLRVSRRAGLLRVLSGLPCLSFTGLEKDRRAWSAPRSHRGGRGRIRSRTCGYVHKRLRIKSAAHHLAGAFSVTVYLL